MGIFDALTTAVAGLQAQSFALQNISGNIANSQTTGYKETDTSFEDLVSEAALGKQTADGVIASSVATNTVPGHDPEHDGVDRHGDQRRRLLRGGEADRAFRQPAGILRRQQLHPRRRLSDEQFGGYLVNGAGYYLMGIPVDASDRQSRRQRRRRFCSSTTISFRRRRPRRSTIRPTCRAHRRRARLLPGPTFSQSARRRAGGGNRRHRGTISPDAVGGRHRNGRNLTNATLLAGVRSRTHQRRQDHYQ